VNLSSEDFLTIWPSLGLCAVALLLAVWDGLVSNPKYKTGGSYLSAAGLVGLIVLSFLYPPSGSAFFGVYVADAWSLFLQRVTFGLGAITLLGGVARARRVIPHRQNEQVFLLLSSILGMSLLYGARDLILLIVSFELMGIPLFLLAAMEKLDLSGGQKKLPAEAGMKFFVLGVVSTPVAMLGASFLIGFSNSTSLVEIAKHAHDPMLVLGLVLLMAGMGYKIGVVPFHMWVPDVYQAAPTPFVAFLSTVPKLAGLAAISRVYVDAFASVQSFWVPVVLGLTTATIILGNLWALPQTNAKRLLGYSGVGHIGYLLMGLVTVNDQGLGMMLFYLVGYSATNIGAFLVLEAVDADGGTGAITDLNGMWKRSPWLAFAMLLFLLSLAGIPFVVGFWAKLYVFIVTWQAGLYWLVLLGAVIAVVSLFYYMQIARAMYMTKPEREEKLKVSPSLAVAILICLGLVTGIGAYPSPWLEDAQQAAKGFVPQSAKVNTPVKTVAQGAINAR
jgi:NADH-quinone oxidoreductase subunit N